jgi:hypothetical protein
VAVPSLLREDTSYYALGDGHTVIRRALYVISREAVTRTYDGGQTPNIAGLGGKVLTQVISRYYYPPGTTDFSVLATKFGYSIMREVLGFAIGLLISGCCETRVWRKHPVVIGSSNTKSLRHPIRIDLNPDLKT